jgi:ABC-type antimicrobial peptide transport system permease subunit
VLALLNEIFLAVILIVMFLCFFALSANMQANISEQTKEIGVLRALGFTSKRISLLYFYEAFVLVIASCILGVTTGTIIGYTMTLQQSLLLSVQLDFYFPFKEVLGMFGLTLVCALVSTIGPITALTRKEIA